MPKVSEGWPDSIEPQSWRDVGLALAYVVYAFIFNLRAGGAPIHGGPLDPLERLGLGHSLIELQQTLGAFDQLACL